LKRRKWRWIGHTLRKPKYNITRQALQWNPRGKCERGRPRNTWRRHLIAEMEIEGYRWRLVGLLPELFVGNLLMPSDVEDVPETVVNIKDLKFTIAKRPLKSYVFFTIEQYNTLEEEPYFVRSFNYFKGEI
jgi:hypothetical protein